MAIYLDHAAATPIDGQVQAVMEPYFRTQFYNPSALYLASKAVAKDLEAARRRLALHLGARSTEIIFTAGGTEANNLAIHGVMQQYPAANIIVSAVEHEAVLLPADNYERRLAPVRPDGRIDLVALEKLIDDHTVLVSIMYANNEIGTIQPLKEVAKIISAKRAQRELLPNAQWPLYLHTDACQAANYLDLHVSRLGVDMMTVNAGKIYGPKQTGLLYVKTGIHLRAQIYGGGQERGLRSGTENVANNIGFAQALDIVQADRQLETQRLLKLRQQFISGLLTVIPSAQLNGSLDYRLPNNVHITFAGHDNERLLMLLDEQNIMCATGSACTANSTEPSHVLKAIGLSDADAQSSLRFTMGRATTSKDIATVIQVLAKLHLSPFDAA